MRCAEYTPRPQLPLAAPPAAAAKGKDGIGDLQVLA